VLNEHLGESPTETKVEEM